MQFPQFTYHKSEQNIGNYNKENLWTRSFVLIAVINFFISCVGNMLMSTFPFYVLELGGNVVTVGVVSGLYAFCALLMRPASGWFLDNISRKLLFNISLIGLMAIPVLYILIPVLAAVIIVRCLHGLFWSAASTASNTNACDIIPKSRFGEGMGYFGLTNSIATAIAPAIGLAIMGSLGFTPLFIGCSVMAVLAFLLLSRLKLQDGNSIRNKSGNENPKVTLSTLFNKDAIPAAMFCFLSSVPGGAISSFIALYAEAEALGNGGVFFTFQAVFAGISRLFSGRIGDSRGEGSLVYISICCFVSGLLLLVFGRSIILFYAAASLIGLGYGISIPSMQAMAVRIVPAERRGSASSTFLCSWDIAWSLGGVLGGILVDIAGYRMMFAVLLAFEVMAVVYYYKWGSKSPSAFRVYQQNKKRE